MDRIAELDAMIRNGYGNVPQPKIPDDWEDRPLVLNLARDPHNVSREDRFRWMRERQVAKAEGSLKWGGLRTCK